jgi:citrate lyase beta subunit
MTGECRGRVAVSDLTATDLRRFGHLGAEAVDSFFELLPTPLRGPSGAEGVGAALGAVLYSPATLEHAAERLFRGSWPGVTAMVFCLEDAIADRDLDEGERRVLRLLKTARAMVDSAGTRSALPYLFVRVRSPEHFEHLLRCWGSLADELDGVVLPKLGAPQAARYMSLMAGAQTGRDRPLWALPILEGTDIALRESRLEALLAVRETIAEHRALVPCVRIGATDLSGLWGLRRPRDFTIYDVAVVRDIIADVVNLLGRDPDSPSISGPVWEYVRDEPVFKPRLRETPFLEEFGAHDGPKFRRRLVSAAIDGLLRETMLDRANGLHGKSVIHPAHAPVVDAAHVVSHEEWTSALAVRAAFDAGDGVSAGRGAPRMNEPKPHAQWAQRTLARAGTFGVLRPEHTFLALLQEPAGAGGTG